MADIARQLAVANILEGSVRKSGNRVRVHVQLIDAEKDAHLWADRYDRELDDIFEVESDIAGKIAEALQATLTGAERRAIAARPTRSTEAHELYLKGRYHWRNFYAPGYERVREYFEQAIALDASYAPASAGLSLYYSWAAANGIFPPDVWPLAEEYARKALSLDDTLPEAYNAIAAVEIYYRRNAAAAERAFRRGAELNPNHGDIPAHYGMYLAYQGRFEEAFAQQKRALELDPFFPGTNIHHGGALFLGRQYERAAAQLIKTLDLFPHNAAAHEYFGNVCAKREMPHEAITQWSAALMLKGQHEDARVLEQTFSSAGFDAAVQALGERELVDLEARRARGEYVAAAHYLFAHLKRGDLEQAMAVLPQTAEEPTWFALTLGVNPMFDPLRQDARFEQIARAAALQ